MRHFEALKCSERVEPTRAAQRFCSFEFLHAALPLLKVEGIDVGHHLYCVRFEAVELWGESAAPRSAVYADLWEPYLQAIA